MALIQSQPNIHHVFEIHMLSADRELSHSFEIEEFYIQINSKNKHAKL